MTVELGTNDIANTSGLTASQLYGYLTTFCSNAHAVGWKVVVATVLPSSGYTTAQQSVWNTYNGLVRTNWSSIADGLADIQSSDVMGPFSATSNTSLYPDGVHPSDLGYTYLAPIFASAVNALTK
jgi:lysophospholipase L1-like esterase